MSQEKAIKIFLTGINLPPAVTAMVEAMEDGVCVQAPDTRIILANSAFAEMVGKPLAEIMGKSCDEIFQCTARHGELPPTCARLLSSHSGRCESEVIEGWRPGQALRARVSPMLDDKGQIFAYIMVVRDVTDVIKRERELARAKQLSVIGELSAGLAHEIKNPLAGIQGAIDILIRQRDAADPERKVLEGVRREVVRIDTTVRALLDCARPRQLQVQNASLTEIVKRAVKLVSAQLSGAPDGRDIAIEIEATERISMTIDAEQIEDAVLNLLLNAIDALQTNGKIAVRVRRTKSNGDNSPEEAVVEIEDNGHGIAESDLARIFSPFYTTKRGGTGLGLAAVRRIARAHGGRVEVKSEPGEGSIFTLCLPITI